VIDVAGIAFSRDLDAGCVPEQTAIPRGQHAPPFGPSSEARKTGAEDRSLDLVQSRVHARFLVMVPVTLTTVSQPLDSSRQRRIVGDDSAAVAERAKIFGRIEAERAGDADRSHGTASGRRKVCLTAIFDNR